MHWFMAIQRNPVLRLAVMLLVVGAIVFVSSAEFLEGGCAEHHDDACGEDCGASCDCIHCIASMQLATVTSVFSGSVRYSLSWSVSPIQECFDDAPPGGIDHPPQLV